MKLALLLLLVTPVVLGKAVNEVEVQRDAIEEEELLVRNKRQTAPWNYIGFWSGVRVSSRVFGYLERKFGEENVMYAGVTEYNDTPEPGPCCRGYRFMPYFTGECRHPSGNLYRSCCADDKTFLPGLGRVGIVNPRRATEDDSDCYECYSTYVENCPFRNSGP